MIQSRSFALSTIARSCLLAASATLSVACNETAQSSGSSDTVASVTALSTPDAELKEPFSYVGPIRELRDGRVIVADRRDKILQLADFSAGTVTQIGREGSGPNEYGMPLSVLPMPGDTTVVFDMLNSRFFTVLPNGEPGGTFRLEEESSQAQRGPGGAAITTAIRNPRASDARGRMYFEGSAIIPGPEGFIQPDSIPVMRFDRTTSVTDTVAWLQMPRSAASATQSGTANQQNVQVRVGSRVPFDSRDSWNVFPDGRIAIVRLSDYHVDIVNPGGPTLAGKPVAFEPVAVGDAEKEEFRQQSRRTPAVRMSVTQDNSGRRESSVSTAPAPFDEPAEWPAVKPPFQQNAIWVRDNGEVWVQRQVSAASAPTFDVFDEAGNHVRQATIPSGERLVGFGPGTVYTVRTDADDLQFLRRYKG